MAAAAGLRGGCQDRCGESIVPTQFCIHLYWFSTASEKSLPIYLLGTILIYEFTVKFYKSEGLAQHAWALGTG